MDLIDHRGGKKVTTARLDQRVVLHDMIDTLFNADEVRDLYHQCGRNYDDETGDKSNRVWRLIDYYSKREQALARKCKAERPSHDWPFLE